MKKLNKVISIGLAVLIILPASYSLVFADTIGSDDINRVLTPDDGVVPYPPENGSHNMLFEEEILEIQNLDEAAKEELWKKHGYTKEEFDALPYGLKNAIINQSEELGKSFNIPTKEEMEKWNRLEAEQLSKTKFSSAYSAANEVRNAVGEHIQLTPYTCGPASAKNAINGYLWANYTRYGNPIPSEPWWGEIPSEARLADDDNLGTYTARNTPFDSRWTRVMNYFLPGHTYKLKWGTASGWETTFWNNVKSTINLSGNYNVIVDLNGKITSNNQLNYEYPIGSSYAHYVCVFGYDPDDNTVFVEDSHDKHSMHMYRVEYSKIAKACRERGIIW